MPKQVNHRESALVRLLRRALEYQAALLARDRRRGWASPQSIQRTIARMERVDGTGTSYTHVVTCTTPGTQSQTIQLELSATDTTQPSGMPSGRFKITATLASGHTATLVDSWCSVTPL
jgi:hypothetical protein